MLEGFPDTDNTATEGKVFEENNKDAITVDVVAIFRAIVEA